jgi:hypothetical protein
MAIASVDNLHELWGILIIAALGIGGIVVPASIMTTIICPDVRFLPLIQYNFRICTIELKNTETGSRCHGIRSYAINTCHWRWRRLYNLL